MESIIEDVIEPKKDVRRSRAKKMKETASLLSKERSPVSIPFVFKFIEADEYRRFKTRTQNQSV